jgi:sugar lactone lactonase YvrE
MPITTPVSIVYDDVDSCLYVAGTGNDRVYRVDPLTGVTTLIASGFGNLVQCCLEIDSPSRRLWVAATGYNRVYEFCLEDPAGVDPHLPGHLVDRFITVTPNPGRVAATVRFVLERPSRANVSIYDVRGQLVNKVLESDLPAGANSVTWNGRDLKGEQVAAGIYFIRLDLKDRAYTAKVLIVK